MNARGIYLCLSGGGYRATAFHLGTLWVLEKLGLLPELRGLSTASGGTLLAARYLRSLCKKQPFQQFFDETSAYLSRENVIAKAADRLAKHGATDPRRRSLIVAASDVYAEDDFVGGMTFADVLALESPLEEISLNATEFETGTAFRFLRSASESAVFGNGNTRVPSAVVPHIRVADVCAASSCFPGGFEPIVFPEDFYWGDKRGEVKARLGDLKTLALMDGGIHDNQGVGPLLLALSRQGVVLPEVLLVSDVHQWDEPLYVAPKQRQRKGFSLGQLATLAKSFIGLGVLAAGALVTVFVLALQRNARFEELALIAFGGLFTLSVAGALFMASRRTRALLTPYWDHPIYNASHYWNALKHLKLQEALQMLELRGTSLLALAARVFMKRVRGAVQREAMAALEDRVKIASAKVYELRDVEAYRVTRQPISAAAKACIDTANAMPTVLWAESPEQLRAVIATGRLTACAALVEWLAKAPQRSEHRAKAEALLAELNAEPLRGLK